MFTKSQFEELWNEILEGEEWEQYKDQEDKVKMLLGLLAWKCPYEAESFHFTVPNLHKLCVKEFVEDWIKRSKDCEAVYEVVSKKYQAAGDADVYYFDYDYATTAPIYPIRTLEELKNILKINLKED